MKLECKTFGILTSIGLRRRYYLDIRRFSGTFRTIVFFLLFNHTIFFNFTTFGPFFMNWFRRFSYLFTSLNFGVVWNCRVFLRLWFFSSYRSEGFFRLGLGRSQTCLRTAINKNWFWIKWVMSNIWVETGLPFRSWGFGEFIITKSHVPTSL